MTAAKGLTRQGTFPQEVLPPDTIHEPLVDERSPDHGQGRRVDRVFALVRAQHEDGPSAGVLVSNVGAWHTEGGKTKRLESLVEDRECNGFTLHDEWSPRAEPALGLETGRIAGLPRDRG